MKIEKINFTATKSSGKTSGIIYLPEQMNSFLVFAHGAGAGMNHSFMNSAAELLAEQNTAILRYNFPYIEKNKKRPDPPNILTAAVKSAVEEAKKYSGKVPLFAGGKSLGGRMTSTAASKNLIPEIKGIIFFGFPLHYPDKPSVERAKHLYDVKVPMLFLQGTRDKLADLELLKPICKKLGKFSTLEIIEGVDHSFHVLKSSGRNDKEVLNELVNKTAGWIKEKSNF